MAPYDVAQVANFFIKRSNDEDIPITIGKLLCITYISYGWYLFFTKNKLFYEPIEVWKTMVVVPKLYELLERIGTTETPVKIYLKRTSLFSSIFGIGEQHIPTGDEETLSILNRVWDSYKNLSFSKIHDKITANNTPFHITRVKYGKYSVISDTVIYNHYTYLFSLLK